MARTIGILLAAFLVSMHLAVAAHELGHALGILLGGGRVERIVMLTPLPAGFVRGDTDVPWLEIWGGMLFGLLSALIPLVIAHCSKRRPMLRFLALMTAAFCLGHNGVYLFVGGLTPFADASGMVALGAPRPLLSAAGATVLAGFVLLLRQALSPFQSAMSGWRRLVAVELGLLAVPALMLTVLLASGKDPAMRTPMVGLVSSYAVCFALAAVGGGSKAPEHQGGEPSPPQTASWFKWMVVTAVATLLIEGLLFPHA